MKKTFFRAVVFFILVILAAVFFPACGKKTEKIKAERRTENNIGNNIVIGDNKKGSGNAAGGDSSGRERPGGDTAGGNMPGGAEREGLPENALNTQDMPGGDAPGVEVLDGAVRNLDKKWVAVYGNGDILDALCKLDVRVATVGSIEVAQTGDNDCASTISVGGRYISAFEFKEALGLKSTMITGIRREGGEYIFTGLGEN